MTQFYQHKVGHPIVVNSVQYEHGALANRLWPTTVNTPPSGFYYVNDKIGLLIFSKFDWEAGIILDYTDLEAPAASRHQTIKLGSEHVRRQA